MSRCNEKCKQYEMNLGETPIQTDKTLKDIAYDSQTFVSK